MTPHAPDATRLTSTTAPGTTTRHQSGGGADSIAHRGAYRPSAARLQARAALTRGRRCPRGPVDHEGEVPGQMALFGDQIDIFEALDEIALERAVGGERP